MAYVENEEEEDGVAAEGDVKGKYVVEDTRQEGGGKKGGWVRRRKYL